MKAAPPHPGREPDTVLWFSLREGQSQHVAISDRGLRGGADAGRYLIAGVKAILADLLRRPGIARTMPPLTGMPDVGRVALIRDYRSAIGLLVTA